MDDLNAAVSAEDAASPDQVLFPVTDRLDDLLFDHLQAVDAADEASEELPFPHRRDSSDLEDISSSNRMSTASASMDGAPPLQPVTVVSSPSHSDLATSTLGVTDACLQVMRLLAMEGLQCACLLLPYAVAFLFDMDATYLVPPARNATSVRVDLVHPWYDLCFYLLAVQVAARVTIALLYRWITRLRHRLPGVLSLLFEASAGWPITSVVWIAATLVLVALGEWDGPPSWETLPDSYLHVSIWLASAATSRALLEAALQYWLNNLTLRHFELRAKDAYSANKVLRRIAAAARVAERREQQQQQLQQSSSRKRSVSLSGSKAAVPDAPVVDLDAIAVDEKGSAWQPSRVDGVCMHAAAATATAATPATSPPRAPPASLPVHEPPPLLPVLSSSSRREHRWDRLGKNLNRLSGPMSLGSGFGDAPTVLAARKRALRVFAILKRQSHLHVPTDATTAGTVADGAAPPVPVLLQRDTLLRWAHVQHGIKGVQLRTAVADSSHALTLSETVDEDAFVGVVERCYKEQRLLTASVKSFSRTHELLRARGTPHLRHRVLEHSYLGSPSTVPPPTIALRHRVLPPLDRQYLHIHVARALSVHWLLRVGRRPCLVGDPRWLGSALDHCADGACAL